MFSKRSAAVVAATAAMVALVTGLGPVGAGPASAATGDLVHTTTFAAPCASHFGLGVAFDGTYLWYSCALGGPDLIRADPLTGAFEGSWDIDGGLGAITYDPVHDAIWAGWDSMHPIGNVTYIPLDSTQSVITTGVTVKFNVGPRATNSLDDGIAYDPTDDSVYVSPDGSTSIDRFTTAGAFLDTRPWVGSTASMLNSPTATCYNSGFAIGAQQFFEGANGCNRVYLANREGNTLAGQFATSFATPSTVGFGRTEGLACDSKTFAPKDALWVVSSSGDVAHAHEIPAGSCGAVDSFADAYTLNATTTDLSGNQVAAVSDVADARAATGRVSNDIAAVALPGGLGGVAVGANTADVSDPFEDRRPRPPKSPRSRSTFRRCRESRQRRVRSRRTALQSVQR